MFNIHFPLNLKPKAAASAFLTAQGKIIKIFSPYNIFESKKGSNPAVTLVSSL